MKAVEKRVREKLFDLQDKDYRNFQEKLCPNVDPDTIIGVRMPDLRKFGSEYAKDPESRRFMKELPHRYYDENNLHGILLEKIRDYEERIAETDRFLPYVDNWATCDMISPGNFSGHREKLINEIRRWVRDSKTYTVRFGIRLLMSLYLEDAFKPEYLEVVAKVKSDEYYVNMMKAWFFATALAKQNTAALPYLEKNRLDEWTHNKTIQKAVESYRITEEQKIYLKSLKRNNSSLHSTKNK